MSPAHLSGKHVPQPATPFWPRIEFGLTATRHGIKKENCKFKIKIK